MENGEWRMGGAGRSVLRLGVVAVASAAALGAHSPFSVLHFPAVRLTIARLHYDGGGDWYANPSSIPNLLAAIRERTAIRVEKAEDIKPALDKALAANRPAVVEVLSDVKAMSKRAWVPTPGGGH